MSIVIQRNGHERDDPNADIAASVKNEKMQDNKPWNTYRDGFLLVLRYILAPLLVVAIPVPID